MKKKKEKKKGEKKKTKQVCEFNKMQKKFGGKQYIVTYIKIIKTQHKIEKLTQLICLKD